MPMLAPPKETGSSSLGVWYANILVFINMKFLLFVNDPTLYTVVLHFPGPPDAAQVFKTFRKNLSASLTTDGINQRMIHHLLKDYEQVGFVTTTSRSMLGSMNDLLNIFHFHIDREIADCNQIDLLKIQYDLNRIPQRKMEWQFSVEAMHEILQCLKAA